MHTDTCKRSDVTNADFALVTLRCRRPDHALEQYVRSRADILSVLGLQVVRYEVVVQGKPRRGSGAAYRVRVAAHLATGSVVIARDRNDAFRAVRDAFDQLGEDLERSGHVAGKLRVLTHQG